MSETANEMKRRWVEEDRARRLADMSALLSSDGGRRLLMHLVTLAGVYRKSEATTEAGLAYEAARRDMGLEVISLGNAAAPQMVIAAMMERSREMSDRAAQIRQAEQQEKPKQEARA